MLDRFGPSQQEAIVFEEVARAPDILPANASMDHLSFHQLSVTISVRSLSRSPTAMTGSLAVGGNAGGGDVVHVLLLEWASDFRTPFAEDGHGRTLPMYCHPSPWRCGQAAGSP